MPPRVTPPVNFGQDIHIREKEGKDEEWDADRKKHPVVLYDTGRADDIDKQEETEKKEDNLEKPLCIF